jgi:hypothetical protein
MHMYLLLFLWYWKEEHLVVQRHGRIESEEQGPAVPRSRLMSTSYGRRIADIMASIVLVLEEEETVAVVAHQGPVESKDGMPEDRSVASPTWPP